jgi:putative spermidine/putrescine transport system ATP-binding protein
MTDLGLPHLIVRNVSKRFGTTTVLDRVDLTIRRGELVTLLGPSGCGKTTLLRAIAGLAQPDQGQVELAGRDITLVPPHRRNVGVVFQSYALFPHLTVAGNIAFGLKVRGRARAEIEAAVERALSLVKLEHLAKRRISALSGGQQQRVALARAPSRSSPTCCCSTRRSRHLIASCARRCRSNCGACCRTWVRRRSSSRTIRMRR